MEGTRRGSMGGSDPGPIPPRCSWPTHSHLPGALACLGFLGLLNRPESGPLLGLDFCSFLGLECSFPRTSPLWLLLSTGLNRMLPPRLVQTSPGTLYPLSSLCFLLSMCNYWRCLLEIFVSISVVSVLPPNAAREGRGFTWPHIPDVAPAPAQCLAHSECPINNS